MMIVIVVTILVFVLVRYREFLPKYKYTVGKYYNCIASFVGANAIIFYNQRANYKQDTMTITI